MFNIVAVFIGGGIGATLRWIMCRAIPSHWGTFVVNIIGACLIGILFQYISQKANFNPHIKLFLMTGLLGGFTTFSTYLLDFVKLFNENVIIEAVFYLFLSIILGVAGLIAGIKIINFFI